MVTGKIKGLIVGGGNGGTEEFAAEIKPLVEIVKQTGDYNEAEEFIRDLKPEAVFMVMNGNARSKIVRAGRLLKHAPETKAFIVADKKDPDLILEGLRMGISDYLVFPDDTGSILASVRNALGRSESGGRAGEVISFFSLKGGQGVTSVCVNTAEALARSSAGKVLVLDLNLFYGNVEIYLGAECDYSPFDLVKDLDRMDSSLLFSSINEHPEGVHVLTASQDINDADMISGEELDAMVDLLKGYFDFILVDLPQDFSEKTLRVMRKSERIMVVVTQEIPAVKSAHKAVELIRELRPEEGDVQIVLNRYDRKHEITPDDLAEVFNGKISAHISEDVKAFSDAVASGKTLSKISGAGKVASDYLYLAGKISGVRPKKKQNKLAGMFTTGIMGIRA